MKRVPFYARLLGGMALLLGLLLLGITAFLNSGWMTRRIQQAIIEGVVDATGARADIPSITWSWRHLTLELRDFSMHGFEPPAGQPLFVSPLIRVRLRILSLLGGDVQISSLVITRPRFYLTVGANGRTNIPGPKHPISNRELISNLINLKLPHLEAEQGVAQINDRQFPLDLVGNQISLLVQYQQPDRRYHVSLRSPAIRLGAKQATYFDGGVTAGGELWRDHFSLTACHLRSPSADVTLTGSLYEFDSPVLDWHLASTFQTTETMRRFGIKGLDGGSISLSGIGHHDPQTPVFFDGRLSADRFNLALTGASIRNASLRSKLLLDSARLQFSDLVFSSREGQIAGSGTLTAARDVQFSGNLSRLNLQTLADLSLHKSLPWSGTITGPLEISAKLGAKAPDLVARGSLNILPLSDRIPISGNVKFNYDGRRAFLAINDSHLRLPNTELTFGGQPGADLNFVLQSSNLGDLHPGLSLFGVLPDIRNLPSLAPGGLARVSGVAHLRNPNSPQIDGELDVSRLRWLGADADRLRSSFSASPSHFGLSSLNLESPLLHASVSGQAALTEWRLASSTPLQASGTYSGAKLDAILKLFNPSMAAAVSGGSASGSFTLEGTTALPALAGRVSVADFEVKGEQIDLVKADLNLSRTQLSASQGQLRTGLATASFSGTYTPQAPLSDTGGSGRPSATRGVLDLLVDTNRFPLSRFNSLSPVFEDVAGEAELHAKTKWTVAPGHVTPLDVAGTAAFRRLLWKGVPVGEVTTSASTQGRVMKGNLEGNLRGSQILGSAEVEMIPGTPAKGALAFDPIPLSTLTALFRPASTKVVSLLSGSARGNLSFDGPLEVPNQLHAVLQLRDLQVKGPPLRALGEEITGSGTPASAAPSELLLQNTAPVTIELKTGTASIQSAQFSGRDTKLALTGSATLTGSQPLHLGMNGGIDLRLLQLIYPDLQIGGQSAIAAALGGTISDPQLTGSVHLANVSVFSPLVPNGLSSLSGAIHFDQHRATLEKVVARSGGGRVTFGGFVTYSANRPLVYRLESTGQDVRVRYANGISITGNSQFSLTGTSDQSLLSGGITISRIVLNPNADLGNVLAVATAPSAPATGTQDYLSHLQMDVQVESSPNLQLDTALSSGVQAEISLRLRGTPKQPVILGSIEANQGDIKVFGSRYTINRAQIGFTNPTRLDPVLDLDLQTQARGITVDITVSGTVNKLNINYRSDPPLQPRDIIALLTVGRAPQTLSTQSNVESTNDANSLQAGANSVLGQAISPVSNRLSKLFGITNIKIDPLVQGITNTPQARLTLEQQISRQITVTYITNLSQTSEQIFRLEYALNPQFSLIALRDDNGEFGIDILYKKRFK